MWNKDDLVEKFGVADESGELVIDYTQVKKAYINRGVQLKHEQNTLAEDFKSLLEEAKENGLDKKRLKLLIDNTYKDEIDAKLEELHELRTELDNLFGDENE